MLEINAILSDLSGQADYYSVESYYVYIGDYYGYTLPFESVENLQKIASDIVDEINGLKIELRKEIFAIELKTEIKELKIQIENLRKERLSLQNEKLKYTYNDIAKIDEAENALKNINKLGIKPSIAL